MNRGNRIHGDKYSRDRRFRDTRLSGTMWWIEWNLGNFNRKWRHSCSKNSLLGVDGRQQRSPTISIMSERYGGNWNNSTRKKNFSNHHNELNETYVSLSRSSNSINPPSQFLFLLQFRSFLRERLNESRKSVDKTGFGKILFFEASRVEEFEEVQLNSTGPRKMAEVEGGRGVVYAVLSDPITSLSSFFPSG